MVLDAFEHGKHVILMNAELDATIGPILQIYARKAGVILSACDGDQPGVEINLFRYVKGLGLTPRVMGNIKGLQDRYRNPTTQKGFAEKWGQNPTMVTSFADGSKVSFEQAIVANATGMKVPKRGMFGRDHEGHVDELTSMYDLEMLRELGGIVDYVVGAKTESRYLLSRRASRPQAASLPQPVQARRGPLVQLLHAVAPLPLRGPQHDRPRGAVRRRGRGPGRRPDGRGLRMREARSAGGRGVGRLRHVHDVRGGREQRRDAQRTGTSPKAWFRGAR